MAKLIIRFKDSMEWHYQDTKEWCKSAFDGIVKALRKPKNDVYVFSNADKFSGDCFRLSEVMTLKLIKENN